MLLILLPNFLITTSVEVSLCLLREDKQRARTSVAVVGANLITNPIAQLSYNYWFFNLWLIELGVIIVETFVFRYVLSLRFTEAIILSCLLNTASILVGIILYGALVV